MTQKAESAKGGESESIHRDDLEHAFGTEVVTVGEKFKMLPNSVLRQTLLQRITGTRFSSLEYLGNNKFELSYMRHTGQWWQLETGTMDDCLKSISTMVPY